MTNRGGRRVVHGCGSVAALVLLYTLVSNAGRFVDPETVPGPLASLLRPDLLPPTQTILAALVSLVTGELPTMEGHHAHPSDHVSHLVGQHVTLQGSLLVSVLQGSVRRGRRGAARHRGGHRHGLEPEDG